MPHKQNAPFVVRWLNGVKDDPNPALTKRAITAACALARYADVKTGHNCYPGAGRCAADMRVSTDTIERGWAELVEAGWLKVHPLPERRRRTQGALKELRWAPRNSPADSGHVGTTHPQAAPHSPAGSGATFPGNQGGPPDPPEESDPTAGAHVCTTWDGFENCVECGAYRWDDSARSYPGGER
jgi:Helix-turn-helix domain